MAFCVKSGKTMISSSSSEMSLKSLLASKSIFVVLSFLLTGWDFALDFLGFLSKFCVLENISFKSMRSLGFKFSLLFCEELCKFAFCSLFFLTITSPRRFARFSSVFSCILSSFFSSTKSSFLGFFTSFFSVFLLTCFLGSSSSFSSFLLTFFGATTLSFALNISGMRFVCIYS